MDPNFPFSKGFCFGATMHWMQMCITPRKGWEREREREVGGKDDQQSTTTVQQLLKKLIYECQWERIPDVEHDTQIRRCNGKWGRKKPKWGDRDCREESLLETKIRKIEGARGVHCFQQPFYSSLPLNLLNRIHTYVCMYVCRWGTWWLLSI